MILVQDDFPGHQRTITVVYAPFIYPEILLQEACYFVTARVGIEIEMRGASGERRGPLSNSRQASRD